MKRRNTYYILNILIAAIWLANGAYCKVLGYVPRHEEIVAQILGETYSAELTILIGFSEIIMGIWVLTKYRSKLNAALQIIIVATMNILEFILVPDLLYWGKANALFAFLFIIIVYYNEFVLNRKLNI